jgi:hypothetical protein
MRLLLHRGPGHLQILSRHHVQEFRDVAAARDFLAPLLRDPRNLAAARTALGTVPMDGGIVDELARRIVAEGLQIVSCGETWVAAVTSTASASSSASEEQTTPLQDEQAAQAAQETAPAADEQHWIEIELLDDLGNPVPDEMYFVELPDGSKISGTTDGRGRARIEGVDPGTAKVSFPDLDKSLYTPGGGS